MIVHGFIMTGTEQKDLAPISSSILPMSLSWAALTELKLNGGDSMVTESMRQATIRTKIRMIDVQLQHKRLTPDEIKRATADMARLQRALNN